LLQDFVLRKEIEVIEEKEEGIDSPKDENVSDCDSK